MVTQAKGSSLQLDDDLASTANGKGASLVSVEDAANNFTANNLEAILVELAAASVGALLRVKGADLTTSDVVAGVLTFGTDGDNYDFTGTDTITSIETVGVGTIKRVHTDDAATITHHASNLICQGGKSFKTEAGGMLVFYEYAVGNWRVYYFPYAKAIDTSHDHAYDNITTSWVVATVQVVGDKVVPTSPDGRLYAECTTAGTTHASTEPDWPVKAGDTVSDNGTVWTMRDGGGQVISQESLADEIKPWILIESQTISGNPTSIDFETGIDGTYGAYMVLFEEVVPTTDGVDLWLRVGTGGTPTYKSGVSDYGYHISSNSDASATYAANVSAAAAQILLADTLSNTTGEGLHGMVHFNSPDNAVAKQIFRVNLGYTGQAGGVDSAIGAGKYDDPILAITALRIMPSGGGTLKDGVISLYGLRE